MVDRPRPLFSMLGMFTLGLSGPSLMSKCSTGSSRTDGAVDGAMLSAREVACDGRASARRRRASTARWAASAAPAWSCKISKLFWEVCPELLEVDDEAISTGSELLTSSTGATYTVDGAEDDATVCAGVDSAAGGVDDAMVSGLLAIL